MGIAASINKQNWEKLNSGFTVFNMKPLQRKMPFFDLHQGSRKT